MGNLTENITTVSSSAEELPFRERLLEEMKKIKPMSRKEYEKWQCDVANNVVGNLTGYDCTECRNRGYFTRLDEYGNQVVAECRCMKIRRAKSRLERSGLAETAEKSTFRTFETPEEWQKTIKLTAMDYAKNNGGKWLFMAGQSGCGKTHLCTAVCTYLINQGHDVRYVLWRDLLHELEGMRFKNEEYSQKMYWLKTIEILYIDDFMKSIGNKPSETEMNYAYEVINARYTAKKTTIISSELLKNDLYKFDSALAGRIFERTGEFIIQISADDGKNYRLK